ncbi:type 1 glutamine amidotransferase [Nocardia brasiliensis]
MLDVLLYTADGNPFPGVDFATRIEQHISAAGLHSERWDLTVPNSSTPPRARAYLFTGGDTPVHAPEPWVRFAIARARALIEDADRDHHAVIGICLGSQLLAEALRPGSVFSLPSIQIGLSSVTSPVRPDADRETVPSYHYQAISPEIAEVPGAVVELHSAIVPVQAFSYRSRVFGCQFHPEFSAADMHRLVDHQRELIAEHRGEATAAHRSIDLRGDYLDKELFRRLIIDRILLHDARLAG